MTDLSPYTKRIGDAIVQEVRKIQDEDGVLVAFVAILGLPDSPDTKLQMLANTPSREFACALMAQYLSAEAGDD